MYLYLLYQECQKLRLVTIVQLENTLQPQVSNMKLVVFFVVPGNFQIKQAAKMPVFARIAMKVFIKNQKEVQFARIVQVDLPTKVKELQNVILYRQDRTVTMEKQKLAS